MLFFPVLHPEVDQDHRHHQAAVPQVPLAHLVHQVLHLVVHQQAVVMHPEIKLKHQRNLGESKLVFAWHIFFLNSLSKIIISEKFT